MVVSKGGSSARLPIRSDRSLLHTQYKLVVFPVFSPRIPPLSQYSHLGQVVIRLEGHVENHCPEFAEVARIPRSIDHLGATQRWIDGKTFYALKNSEAGCYYSSTCFERQAPMFIQTV